MDNTAKLGKQLFLYALNLHTVNNKSIKQMQFIPNANSIKKELNNGVDNNPDFIRYLNKLKELIRTMVINHDTTFYLNKSPFESFNTRIIEILEENGYTVQEDSDDDMSIIRFKISIT